MNCFVLHLGNEAVISSSKGSCLIPRKGNGYARHLAKINPKCDVFDLAKISDFDIDMGMEY